MSYPATYYQERPTGFNTFYNRGYQQEWLGKGAYQSINFIDKGGGKEESESESDEMEGGIKRTMDFFTTDDKGKKHRITNALMKSKLGMWEVKGYSKMTRPQLIEAYKRLKDIDNPADRKTKHKEVYASVKEMKSFLKSKGVKGLTKMKKAQLTPLYRKEKGIEEIAPEPLIIPKLRKFRIKRNDVPMSLSDQKEKKKPKIDPKEVMKYKYEKNVSLKDAWAHFKNPDVKQEKKEKSREDMANEFNADMERIKKGKKRLI